MGHNGSYKSSQIWSFHYCKKPLADHVFKIKKFEGYRIAITFAFRGKYQSTYNPSFTNKLSISYITEIRTVDSTNY